MYIFVWIIIYIDLLSVGPVFMFYWFLSKSLKINMHVKSYNNFSFKFSSLQEDSLKNVACCISLDSNITLSFNKND